MAPKLRDSRGTHHYDPTRDPNSDTYIDRGTTADTGDEVEQQAESQVAAEEADDGWLEGLLNVFTHDGEVSDAYNQQMNAQASELAQGVPTRDAPPMMCSNYLANPHPELKAMVTEDVDPDAVGEVGDLWIDAGNAMTRFQTGVAAAINNSQGDWQGSAGDAARGFMASVGNWVGTAGQSAQLAGTQTNLQAAALAEAKRAMPEPVEFDIEAANNDLQNTSNPLELITKYNEYLDQYNAQQEAHQQAAQVVNGYDSGLAGASTMPAFGPPPTMGTSSSDVLVDQTDIRPRVVDPSVNPNDVGTGDHTSSQDDTDNGVIDVPQPPDDPDGPNVPDGPNDPNGPNGPNGPNVPSGPNDPDGPNGPNVPNGPNGPDGPNGPQGPDDGTNPSSEVPGGFPNPGQFPTPGSNLGPNPGSNAGQNAGFPGAPLPVGGFGGGPGGGDFERGGRGYGPGGGFGGGPGGGGAGGGPGGQGGIGRGGSIGGGPGGGFAAEGGAMRGGPGGAGRGGAGGMMPLAGNRADGEEDGEHKRPSFLVEGDPDAVFGTDEMTAPPVIGG